MISVKRRFTAFNGVQQLITAFLDYFDFDYIPFLKAPPSFENAHQKFLDALVLHEQYLEYRLTKTEEKFGVWL